MRSEDAKRVARVAGHAREDLGSAAKKIGDAINRFNDGMDVLRPTAKRVCEKDAQLSASYREVESNLAAARKHVSAASRALESIRTAAS
jgi:hypothetical protein